MLSPSQVWPPWAAALAMLMLGFGGTMLSRIFVERRWPPYFTRWWAFRLGESIGLPGFAGFAAAALQGQPSTVEFWPIIVVISVTVFALSDEYKVIRQKYRTLENANLFSQKYHASMMGVCAAWVAQTLVALYVAPWENYTWIALGFLLFYFYTLLVLDGESWAKGGAEKTPRVD